MAVVNGLVPRCAKIPAHRCALHLLFASFVVTVLMTLLAVSSRAADASPDVPDRFRVGLLNWEQLKEEADGRRLLSLFTEFTEARAFQSWTFKLVALPAGRRRGPRSVSVVELRVSDIAGSASVGRYFHRAWLRLRNARFARGDSRRVRDYSRYVSKDPAVSRRFRRISSGSTVDG